MDDLWFRITDSLADRASGPLHLRLVLQPVVASVLAIRAGLKDAKAAKAPYFWALATDPAHRREMLEEGWKSIGKVFVLAMVLDIAYQLIANRTLRPGEAFVVSCLLALVPYLLLRGLVNRAARRT